MRFNYIVTIHNKEDMISAVVERILMCNRHECAIYLVFDGCTDNSETIIDELILKFSNVPITKIYCNDVHELLSINAALEQANHEGTGFNILLQDDVLLGDYLFEYRVEQLYAQFNGRLGYVSFRLAADLHETILENDTPRLPLKNYIENVCGHGIPEAVPVDIGSFLVRDVPIKSPTCIPFYLLRDIGMLNADLAPYAHDDTDYAIRSLSRGYINGLFAINFESELKWGGTRQKPHPKIASIQKRNINIIKQKYFKEISRILSQTNSEDNELKLFQEKEAILVEKRKKFKNARTQNTGTGYWILIKSILRKCFSFK